MTLAALTMAAALAIPTAGGLEPAPPAVQLEADRAAAWLRRRGWPVTAQPVLVGPTPIINGLPADGATFTGAMVLSPTTAADLIGRPGTPWHASAVATVLHEHLHTIRATTSWADWDEGQRHVEEGLVTALTADLVGAYMSARRWPPLEPAQSIHVRWARMVRGVSRRATHHHPDTPAARRWRKALLLADTERRAAMWTAATTLE